MEQDGGLRTVIRCDGITKEFATRRGVAKVIDGVQMRIRENEFVALFGPGQCGKTTLMNILAGLEMPTGGEVFIRDRPVKAPGADRGVIFQSIALFPWLTVMGNVEYGLKVRGVRREERKKKAAYYIDLVGLKGFENAYPNKLSGGMKQRVGIARAYCNEPEVLFMDEPFSALDAQTRYLMQHEIMKIWEKERRTIVFITNNIEEALYLADRIILLSNCPAGIKEEYVIDLPRPRNYTSEDFLMLRNLITQNMDKVL